MKELVVRTAVVGSGCAGLNAADWLYSLGERDFVLVTENMLSGTSRNTGSDKQTYYKLSLAGDEGDSVFDLARTLKREDVDGDIALCEAAGSAQCFFKLVSLGVPFPCNSFGEYAGYQTDHDERRRATSAGPLTSRYMTEALEASVHKCGAAILDHTMAFRILADDHGVCGLQCLNTQDMTFMTIRCAYIILATGGPAAVYRDSVYPESQSGMSGMAFAAGAKGANLDCWQYGLASVKFRWNVSGSYQQALPRYVSIDQDGCEHDFLSDHLTFSEKLQSTFLKGYQWPFDPLKLNGSSRIDMLVKAETDKGRRVFLDYRCNPEGCSLDALSEEARAYLVNCGAAQNAPIERLRAINPPAIELYKDHGIDLEKEMLEIRVCAQHHNGGIAVDSDWQSGIPGLYVCGEAAGTFGRYRPGGTALNSTQVGSMRAAMHIAHASRRSIPAAVPEAAPLMLPDGDAEALTIEIQTLMTRFAAFQREEEGMRLLMARLDDIGRSLIPLSLEDPQLIPRLRLRDIMITQRQVLSAMLFSLNNSESGVLETSGGQSARRPARPIPERDLWFESVWRKYRSGMA
jgi:succinate dehydrogenase/fumarate reductase flavoprotein subunit